MEGGEDEGDGAPTDAVFGLEEGADDELMAGEHGGEDEPGGPAGVGPGGLGAPEEIGEGQGEGVGEDEGVGGGGGGAEPEAEDGP